MSDATYRVVFDRIGATARPAALTVAAATLDELADAIEAYAYTFGTREHVGVYLGGDSPGEVWIRHGWADSVLCGRYERTTA